MTSTSLGTKLLRCCPSCHTSQKCQCPPFLHSSSPVIILECDLWWMVLQGGNDYEIFMSPKTKGHTVTSPIDTVQQCTDLFIKPAKVSLQC